MANYFLSLKRGQSRLGQGRMKFQELSSVGKLRHSWYWRGGKTQGQCYI